MEPWLAVTIKVVIFLGMLVGLFGLVVPVFPGLLVIWVLALLHGVIFGFNLLSLILFVVISLLAVVGELADNVLMGRKALRGGARWRSIALAFVAGLIGSLLLTPIGGIAAALGALYLSEYAVDQNSERAWAITREMAIGWGWAFVVRFALGVVMIGLWVIWAWT
jgi:hypothetical protein